MKLKVNRRLLRSGMLREKFAGTPLHAKARNENQRYEYRCRYDNHHNQ
jgi:hypothetical protein